MSDASLESEVTPEGERQNGSPRSEIESELSRLHSEWDETISERVSLDREEAEEMVSRSDYDSRVSEFESQVTNLENEKVELNRRLADAEVVHDFLGECIERQDTFDFARCSERIVDATSLDKRAAENELRLRLLDESFLEAADGRFDDGDKFQNLFEDFVSELQEMYPRCEKNHGLASAIFASRQSVSVGDDGDYPDLSKLSDREFDAAKREIFEDMRSGKLRPNGRAGGGFLSTKPR